MNVINVSTQHYGYSKIIPNLVILNGAVGCRRVFTWVVLLLISMLLRVWCEGESAYSSCWLSITECWSCQH